MLLRYVLGPRVGPLWLDPPPLAVPAATTHAGKTNRTASGVAADLASGSPAVTLTFDDVAEGVEHNEPVECRAYFMPADSLPPIDATAWADSPFPFATCYGPFSPGSSAAMHLPGPMPTHYVVQTIFGFPE